MKYEIVQIQGKSVLKFNFLIQEINYTMYIPLLTYPDFMIEPGDQKTVGVRTYRPNEAHHYQNQNDMISSPLNEFIKDVTFFENYFNKNGFDNESIPNSLVQICRNHIAEYKRIIDSDLYSYTDILLVLISYIEKRNGVDKKEDEMRQLWEMGVHFTLPKIKDYLYITKFDMSNPTQPRPYLEKVT